MRKGRLNREKQVRLIEYFVAGSTARCAADLVGVNTTTAAYLSQAAENNSRRRSNEGDEFGEFEVDESYFGGRRKGKRRRGAAGKVPVFGILKRGGKVYPS